MLLRIVVVDDDVFFVQGQRVIGHGYSVTKRLSLKNRYRSRTDRLTEFKLCANYPIV